MKKMFNAIKSFFSSPKQTPAPISQKYDQSAIDKQLDSDIVGMIKEDLIAKAKAIPLCNVDGKPNQQWVKTFSLGFPNLTEGEIVAKQLELIAEEISVIDAFLNKEIVVAGDEAWIDELQPELKRDELGYWHVKINGQWTAIASIGDFYPGYKPMTR